MQRILCGRANVWILLSKQVRRQGGALGAHTRSAWWDRRRFKIEQTNVELVGLTISKHFLQFEDVIFQNFSREACHWTPLKVFCLSTRMAYHSNINFLISVLKVCPPPPPPPFPWKILATGQKNNVLWATPVTRNFIAGITVYIWTGYTTYQKGFQGFLLFLKKIWKIWKNLGRS